MSVRVMSLVWDNFNRGGSEKLAMLALADWCNDQGGSLYPSIAAIAKKINTSDCQARRIVHGLIDEGYLAVVGNHAGGNPGQARQYVLNVKKLLTTSADATPIVDATPSAHARQPLAPMRVTPSVDATLTINEPSIDPPIVITPPQAKSSKANRKHSIPEDFEPKQNHYDLAKSLSVDLMAELPSFCDHHVAKGSVMANWDSALNTWLRNAAKWAKPNQQTQTKGRTRHEQLADKLADLTGSHRRNQSSNQGVIHGTAERLD